MKKRHNPIPDCLVHGIKGCSDCSKKLGTKKPLKTAEERAFIEKEKFHKKYTNFCKDMVRISRLIRNEELLTIFSDRENLNNNQQ